MSATPRPPGPSAVARLLEAPHRFEFFQAVRMLEQLLIAHGVPEGRAVKDYLRFDNSVSMSFPASQIESIRLHGASPITDLGMLIEAIRNDPGLRIHITPTFMGLLGVAGVLPGHYAEDIARHAHEQQDDEARRFFDLFSSRIVSQFYQAWAKYRVDCQPPAARRDGHLAAMLSVAGGPTLRAQARAGRGDDVHAGLGPARETAQGHASIADEVVAFYAAAIRQRPVSAVTIERVLSEYFDAPIVLEPFVPSWYPLSAGQRTRLGRNNSTLGRDMVIGARLPRRDLRMRVKVGPLGRHAYDAFMPDGSAGLALGTMLTLFDTGVRSFEVEVSLRAQEVPAAKLRPHAADSVRLGMTFFLGAKPAVKDQSMRYMLRM